MNTTPIKHGFVKFRKDNLIDNRLLIGIDSGSLLTKVIYVHRDNSTQLFDSHTDHVTLTYGIFENVDFVAAMTWTKEHAFVPANTNCTIRITGTGARNNKLVIESILGFPTEFVDEETSLVTGHSLALSHISLEELMALPVEVESMGDIDSRFLENFTKGFASKFEKEVASIDGAKSSLFPCLVRTYDSSSAFYYFDHNGRGELISYPLTGGASFLGLAKCLLDTNNYDEIMTLASKGNRANVDTQVKDVMIDDVNSPYGKMPPDLPVFPFGKSMDLNTGLEDYAKEDVAISLVAFFCMSMVMQGSYICLQKLIRKIYMTGNIFRSDLFQKEVKRILTVFPFFLQLEFLDFGYYGALGALFYNEDEKDKYCKS